MASSADKKLRAAKKALANHKPRSEMARAALMRRAGPCEGQIPRRERGRRAWRRDVD